ncbi:MAG: hypothetical protein AAB527_03925 [Patescibacteria group bacterium]
MLRSNGFKFIFKKTPYIFLRIFLVILFVVFSGLLPASYFQAEAASCTITGGPINLGGANEGLWYGGITVSDNRIIFLPWAGSGELGALTFNGCGTLSSPNFNPGAGYGFPSHFIPNGNKLDVYNWNGGSGPTVYAGSIVFSWPPNMSISLGSGWGINLYSEGPSVYITTSGNIVYSSGGDTSPGSAVFTATGCSGPVSISWTDPTITANSTKIRKVHIDEMRSWINNRRTDASLGTYSWTDSTIYVNSTKIRKVHFDEMRTAISQAYTACGQSMPSWTDLTLTVNSTKIRKVHVDELRNAISQAP